MEDEQVIPILLLGDAVGKTALISRFVLGARAPHSKKLPDLRDDDQPFIFSIRRPRRHEYDRGQLHYRLEFYDTSYAAESYALLQPSMIILCFSIPSRASLESVQKRWKPLVDTHFDSAERLPVMLIGLQRDLRTEEREAVRANDFGAVILDDGTAARYKCVFPQEGLRVAQEMRCDRYGECSAVTGELCREVFEDVVQLAVKTVGGPGAAKSDHTFLCNIM